jgi:23S rRNA C2498 (ribose-2'-O)-methylase RlmM
MWLQALRRSVLDAKAEVRRLSEELKASQLAGERQHMQLAQQQSDLDHSRLVSCLVTLTYRISYAMFVFRLFFNRREASSSKTELQRSQELINSLRASLSATQGELQRTDDERSQLVQRLGATEQLARQQKEVRLFLTAVTPRCAAPVCNALD